ncbi:hypothetical protein AVT98_gp08 [Sulfolobales virus YNP1]|jgi:hypothetical protein|uniref:hypothetical protein n=1 Tax=Sulfolobales virus YNP1 TaxID=1732179 RepID=UPI000706BA55|nr:hypothetical protein AVT98_gp08 [Sulfolobales virus YNP1]ALG97100.1 hypothetical protein [Sulfolobales virus YNP1]
MNILDIITAYNPLFSPEKENIIMVPLEYVEQVKELAKLHNAKIQIFQKRRSKYAYIKWYFTGEKDER